MNQRRWGWLLLCMCAFLLLMGWPKLPAAWTIWHWEVPIASSWLILVWIFALFSPPELRWHPAAGAWIAWVFWIGVSRVFSSDPSQGLQSWAWQATCVLLFILAHAWWGGAHRRAWLVGLWSIFPLAVFLWPKTLSATLFSAAVAASAVYASRKKPEMLPTAVVISAVAWTGLLVWRKISFGGSETPYLLRLVAQTGWVGLGLFACAVWKSIPANFKSLSWEGRAAAAALYALLAESFVDDSLSNPALQILAFSAIACASNWARAQEESELSRLVEERHGRTKPLWAGALGLTLCLTALMAERSKALALTDTRSPQAQQRIAGYERLAQLEPSNAAERVLLARELLFSQPSRLGSPLARLDEALRLNPGNPVYLGLKAELFSMAGDWERSAQWAGKALEIEPDFPEARLILAESLANRGDRDNAMRQLAQAKKSRESAPPGSFKNATWDERRYERVLKICEIHKSKSPNVPAPSFPRKRESIQKNLHDGPPPSRG